MAEKLYIDDFENDDVVCFSAAYRISINTQKRTFRVFESRGSAWIHIKFQLSDLRSIERVSVSPQREIAGNYGSAKGMGDGIRVAISNSVEKSKAKSQTGGKIYLKSVDLPSVFLTIQSQTERERLYEALHQIIEGT